MVEGHPAPSKHDVPTTTDASRWSLVLFSVALCVAVFLSLQPRLQQYEALSDGGSIAAGESIPSSTHDAYYWFRLAREHRAGTEFEGLDPLRRFPDGTPYEPLPAMSWLIAKTTDLLGTNVYHAGLCIAVLLSSLFVIPLGLYGWRVGYPAAGLLAALIGSFSAAFYRRSYVHKVDTDGGNLFFVWLIALMMASLRSRQSSRQQHLIAAGSGLAVNGFCWWYAVPGFWIIYAATFLLIVLVLGQPWRRSLSLMAIYAVASNPWNLIAGAESLYAFVADYLLASAEVTGGDALGTGLVFPDVTAEIAELTRYDFWRTLRGTLGHPAVASLGLLGFFAFLATSWRRALPLLPIMALALLGFVWASRMVMYAAPLVGFGLGYLATVAIEALSRLWQTRRAGAPAPVPASNRHTSVTVVMTQVVTYAAIALALFLVLDQTSHGRRPRPEIDEKLVAGLREVRDTLPQGAAIFTTWPYGYLVTDVTRAATFDDGRDPDDVVQQLVARGITSPGPSELADIAAYLSRFGRAGVVELASSSTSYADLLARMSREAATSNEAQVPVFVLFTEGMLRKEFGSYFYRGQWDFESGTGPKDGFSVWSCRGRPETSKLACRSPKNGNVELDLETGQVNGQPVLQRILRTRAGEVFSEKSYRSSQPFSFETIEIEGSPNTIGLLMTDAVYRSNFNQMFVLGRVDRALFREFHNDFPVLRVFELKAPSPP